LACKCKYIYKHENIYITSLMLALLATRIS
jgi:hypothetical protein